MGQFSGVFSLSQVTKAVRDRNWTNVPPPGVEYLVVAGGGGAGAASPGGGGAGGLLVGSVGVVVGSAITVTVGAGGSGTSGTTLPGNGTNSVFGSVVAIGGGAGANNATGGASGGSGGGGGPSGATNAAFGQGLPNQGNPGGSSSSGSASGGGGGAGTAGLNGGPAGTHAGNGGAGIASDISGTRTTYAGGGGGYSTNIGSGVTGGFGGVGGGGASSNQFLAGGGNGQSGTANTGGGGGCAPNYTGGAGGSGIVIISYPDTYAAAASTTGSPTVSTSGSGSISFNGSTQTVSTAASSLLALGSGSFTIEYWVKINGSGSFSRSFLITGTSSVSIESNTYTSSVTPYYLNYGGTQTAITTGSSFDVTQWHHVAIVRNGTTLRVYLNGVQAMSVTDSTNYSANGTLYLGSNNSNNWLNGYITNFRLVKGTAVYTANFTPPTVPLASISGTSILVGAVSGSFLSDSSGNGFTFTNTGSTPWNSASPFATGLGYKNRVYTWTSSGSITF